MKICTSCVIPETSETINFSSDGTCSICKQIDFKHTKIDWQSRIEEFDKILNNYKNKTKYDCIVPFSGGKDSTYTLWYVVKKKKLKPLVVRYDHQFYRKNSEENRERTLNILNVDFINFKSNFEIIKKTMLESLIRRGDFCWHCHVGIASYPLKIAIEKKIPLVIYGEPSAEYSSFHNYDEFETMDEEKVSLTTNMGINAEDMYEMLCERYPDKKFDKRDFDPFIFPSNRELKVNKIKTVYLGNYVPWDVRKQVEIIKSELNWKEDEVEGIPPEYGYEKIECIMQGMRDYIKFLKRGFGRTAHLTSIDIRNGRMRREKALELVKIYDGKKPKTLSLFLKIIKISEDEFYDIVIDHIVYPSKKWDKKEEKLKTSNTTLKDFDSWISKEI